MTRDYKKDVEIDEHNIEQEWLEHSSLYLYYAEAHADAVHEKDMAKSRLDLTYAQLYSNIKKDWEKYFNDKPTEPAIKEYILSDPSYKKAERALIDSARDANIMLAAKTAFDHRKRALENLVSLKIGGFYSEPRNKTRTIKSTGGHKAQKDSLNRNGARAKSRINRIKKKEK